MKITAKKRDDILRRKEAYDKEYKRVHDLQQESYNKYRTARRDALNPIEKAVMNMLPHKNDTSIDVDTSFGGVIECVVRYAENKQFDKGVALSWNYNASLDPKTGEIKTESGSWSGLNVTTPEAVQNLKNSVENIEVLTSADWKSLLDVAMPEYEDYMKDVPNFPEKENFDDELFDADIEETLESGEFVKGIPNSGKAYRGQVYYRILKETPTQVEVEEVHESQIDDYIANNKEGYVYRIKKSNLKDKIKTPVEFYN